MSLVEHQRKYRAAIHAARVQGLQRFHAWFNRESSQTLRQATVRGFWDFTLHVLTPTVCRYLSRPEEQIALEIGYGGGRLMNAACHYFHEVIGSDIHAEQETVAAFLRSQGHTNFRLLPSTGRTLETAQSSVDFIYSFIVLQHLPSFDVFVDYIREVSRCLKPRGVAQLYFGKYTRLHPLYQLWYFGQGYRAVSRAPANHISLVVRVAKVRKVCHDHGLSVVETGTSYYCVPDGYPHTTGGQTYVTLVKGE